MKHAYRGDANYSHVVSVICLPIAQKKSLCSFLAPLSSFFNNNAGCNGQNKYERNILKYVF